jgi:hypothetical protein
MGSKKQRSVVLGVEVLLYELSPELTGGAELGDLEEEVHSNTKEEREARSNIIDGDSSLHTASDVLNAVSESKGKLKSSISLIQKHVRLSGRSVNH